MEPTLEAAVCLICFEMTENHIYVPADAPEKIFSICNKYLHSTLTQENLKDVQLSDKNQLPLCKSCFDSALELRQLSQQLSAIEKDISDLTVAFSMAVFHRRSQVYKLNQMQNNSPSFQNSSTIEFNEACLPPNLFSTKTEDQNINHYNSNHDIVINSLDTKTNISNVKLEISDPPFDNNMSGNSQPLVAKNVTEIKFNNKENIDKNSGQPTIEDNESLVLSSKITNVNSVGENGSITCANSNSGMKLSLSDLLKSVKMPAIRLERLKIDSLEGGVSVLKSYQTKCESPKKITDVTLLENKKFSKASDAPNSSGIEKFVVVRHRSHTVEKPYKCSFCPQKFVSRTNQKIHERMHTGSNPFKCSFCEKRFHAMTNLLIHERVHTGEKPYDCSFCDKKFSQFGGLRQHERVHTGEKPFKCSFCEKSFAIITTMKNHERTHTGEKPFACSFCKKAFSSLGAVKLHERLHTGEKPFQCSFCNKSFPVKSMLQTHERTHTGEKPFTCSFCKKGFSSLGGVKLHEMLHTGEKPFQCSFCNKSFPVKAMLQTHERIHTGENPYTCSFCKKGFRAMSNLKIHERIHTGEKPYKCLYCERSFSQLSGKKSHQETHRKKRHPSLVCPICNLKCGSLAHLKHHENMHSKMIFHRTEDQNIHDKTHNRDQIVNDNLHTFIVGI